MISLVRPSEFENPVVVVGCFLEHEGHILLLLQTRGVQVFDQMPYEKPMERVKATLVSNTYARGILDDFYLPIFEKGYISKFYFLPGWETSVGETWEHEQAKRLGTEIEYL